MVGGMSRVGHDIPPYTIGGGIPFKVGGINIVGLKRRGFSLEVRNALCRAFKIFYRSDLKLTEALELAEKECAQIKEIQSWVDFCSTPSSRGIMGFQSLT